ncbi:MAG: glycine oxidase [Paenibacillus sp.]|jgi:glycine oxidase|nr:glycine oxidase [Paenibacillus sp.]
MSEHLLVIGGGVIGLSCAYELRKRGYQVTVAEQHTCGGQASGAAAGMLAPFSENSEQPDAFFQLCRESLKQFELWQQEIRKVSGMDFEYSRSGSLYVYFHEADRLAMETRQMWQQPYGAEARIVTGDELFQLEPELSRSARGALYYPNETHVYAPHYVKALEQACRNIGVIIYEQAGAISMEEDHSSENAAVVVRLGSGTVLHADRLVLSTGAWSQHWEQALGIKMPVYPIRGQICAYESADVGQLRHMVFCSQGYMVGKANGSLVCGASEDIAGFNTAVTAKGLARLESWNSKLLPTLQEHAPFHQWAGLRPATQDGWPLIGTTLQAKHVLFAVGHYRNGILLSPATARLVADLAGGQSRYYEDTTLKQFIAAFAPDRFS